MTKTDSRFPYKPALLALGGLLLIIILDQALKVYIKTDFSPGEIRPLFGNWLLLEYIENQGMAFGTTFGSSKYSKLALSIFRIIAIGGMIWYYLKRIKEGVQWDFHLAAVFVVAGALGNLIDSMFYDFLFPYDPCMPFNILEGSGKLADCGIFGELETKHYGFLYGNVVDMFKFHGYWPDWVPGLGGSQVFPAIWNLADGSITLGVLLIFIRQKTFFPKA